MAAVLSPEYQRVYNQIHSFHANLNRLKQLRERSTIPQLIQQADQVNRLVQDLLTAQQSLLQSIRKLNYGENYHAGQADRPYPRIIDAYGKCLEFMSAELNHLERLQRMQNFPYQPNRPWFFIRWTSGIRTSGAKIGHEIAALASPFTNIVRCLSAHPCAITAASAGLVAAGSLAMCQPEIASGMLKRVLPPSIQPMAADAIHTDSALLHGSGYTIALYQVGAAASALFAVSAYCGVREPSANACRQIGQALTFAHQHPGQATANTLHAIVWDIPAGAAKLGYRAVAETAGAVRSIFHYMGTYSKNALWIAPFAAAGATYAAHNQGVSSSRLALICAGAVTAHLALKGLHASLTH